MKSVRAGGFAARAAAARSNAGGGRWCEGSTICSGGGHWFVSGAMVVLSKAIQYVAMVAIGRLN